MSNGGELKGRSAKALRAAGYIPLPRLWVTQAQMEVIKRIAEGNRDAVNEIRAKARRGETDDT